MQLENGTVIENGSCVAPGECRAGVYALTYGPNSSLWVSTTCCENKCSSPPGQDAGPKAQPNTVKCHYCSGNKSALCDSLSVMNCTGKQTACVTLNGTWSRGPHATVTHHKDKATICFTCSDLYRCDPLPCPEDRSYCLQTAGVTALGEGSSVTWRNGYCVASTDCRVDNSISALTYGVSFGFWVNTTCCRGNCQEPIPLAAQLASPTLSNFLCPTCPGSHLGPCNSSFYMQCPSGETNCVQLDLVSEEGGRNVSVRGCGSRDLCSGRTVTHGLLELPGHRLARPPECSSGHRAVVESQCRSGAAPGLRLALPALLAALALSSP
nr:uncharacterized protein LOC105869470 isoform X2 [Microcebus murinus]